MDSSRNTAKEGASQDDTANQEELLQVTLPRSRSWDNTLVNEVVFEQSLLEQRERNRASSPSTPRAALPPVDIPPRASRIRKRARCNSVGASPPKTRAITRSQAKRIREQESETAGEDEPANIGQDLNRQPLSRDPMAPPIAPEPNARPMPDRKLTDPPDPPMEGAQGPGGAVDGVTAI